jgi:hypothetical protein
VTAGRVVGVLIIFVGIALSAWDAWDFYPSEVDNKFRWHVFLNSAILRVSYGALVILAAEIADRLWRNPGDALSTNAAEAMPADAE